MREGPEDHALAKLIAYLKSRDYRFVTPTPATHARVLARRAGESARDLRDVFGWSMPFDPASFDPAPIRLLDEAGMIERTESGLKSKLRVSLLGRNLFLHSSYPTDSPDAVFFGPDSYRFARLIADELRRRPRKESARLVDIGAGAGVGAIVATGLYPALRIVMTDVNPVALRLARINAAAAGVSAAFHEGADLSSVTGDFDLVLANPPYIADTAGRAYRDGGPMHGGAVALAMAQEAVPRLSAGGRLLLYTGSAIVGGEDEMRDRLAALAEAERCDLRYDEIDPDVFGEELESPGYRDVERIALVAAVIERRERTP